MHALLLLLSALCILGCVEGFLPAAKMRRLKLTKSADEYQQLVPLTVNYGQALMNRRRMPLRDILGLGPAEIAVTLVAALLLFGPETLKSLTKDVGKAAAELKELPKTFKEGMDEGSTTSQVAKMKAIAAEKRAKRDAALGDNGDAEGDEETDKADP
jgi:Sec-independent protein translocase protein TatA